MSRKSTTETKNTYQYLPAPVTPALSQAESISDRMRGQIDPQLRGAYGKLRSDFDNSYLNPSGSQTTPGERDAMRRAGQLELATSEGSDMTQGAQHAGEMDFQRKMSLAELTSPQLVQTGGSSTSTNSGGVLSGILGGAANAASSYLSRAKPTTPQYKYGKLQTLSAGGLSTSGAVQTNLLGSRPMETLSPAVALM